MSGARAVRRPRRAGETVVRGSEGTGGGVPGAGTNMPGDLSLALVAADLDLDDAVPYDGRETNGGYVVPAPGRRHLRVSATGLFLLRAVRDGAGATAIAERLSRQNGEPVSEPAVLAACGALAGQIRTSLARDPRSRTGLWGAVPLMSERVVRRCSRPLTGAFRPLAVALAVTAASGALLAAALTRPVADIRGGDVVIGYPLFLLALLLHELGHAAAAQRGGARPQRVGFVIYLVWPAFFSDVSESWRLRRGARVTVDIGGVYFQYLATGLAAVCYAATGWRPLGAMVLMSLLGCLANLNPFFRFDGYWLLADALGVERPHARGRAALVGLVRGRRDGAVSYVLAGYALITWAIWIVFGISIAVGGYRRILLLPFLARRILAGTAVGGDYWQAFIAVTLLIMVGVLVVRGGRLAVAALIGFARRRGMTGPADREVAPS